MFVFLPSLNPPKTPASTVSGGASFPFLPMAPMLLHNRWWSLNPQPNRFREQNVIQLEIFHPKTSSCWKLWEVPLEKIHHVLSGCLSLFGFKTRTWRSQKADEKKLFRLSRRDPSVARGRMLKQHLRLIGWATCKVISNNHSLNTERLLLNRSSLKSWNPKVWWWEKGCDYQRSFPLFSTTKRADILPE